MSELFLNVLNMSLTASYVIIFVMIVRLLLKKAPKFISYLLWGVVAFRLLIPFSFESMFSLMPRNTNVVSVPYDIIYQQSSQINIIETESIDLILNDSLPTLNIESSMNPLQVYIEIGSYVWILGTIAMLVYSFLSILLLKRQLKNAQLIEKNIFEAKNLKTPFVLGLINPKIYLPAGLGREEQNYILIHEQAHIHRKDHVVKALAFLIVSIHWFNPLVWLAFRLMSTDMELSCDEKVLKVMNEDIRKPYANSLLSLATGKYILNGSPLAFGEGNVKGRIKNVLNYKKPKFWIVLFSIIIVAAISIGLAANPKSAASFNGLSYRVKEILYQSGKYSFAYTLDNAPQYSISSDFSLYSKQINDEDWNMQGVLYPYEISRQELNSLFMQPYVPPYNNFHRVIDQAKLIYRTDTDDDIKTFYLVMQLKNGDVLLAVGYDNEDLSHIRWLFRLEKVSDFNNITEGTITQQEWHNALSIKQEVKLPDFEYHGSDPIEKLVYATEIKKYSQPERGFTIVAPKIFGSYEENGMLKVFVTTYSATYKLYGNVLDMVGGSVVPSAITYKKDNSGNYVLEKYEQSKDGADWKPSIKEFCTMPVSGKEIPGLAEKIVDHYGNYDDIRSLHWENLTRHLIENGIKEATLFNSSGEIEFSMSNPHYIN